MTDTQGQGDCWWREFFGSEDGIPLSFFPSEDDTDAEVAGLMGLLDLQPGMTVADICCGAGRHSLRLAKRGLDVVGLDASDFMLAKAVAADENDACNFVQGDAAALPFADASFDVALNLFNSFGYFEDDEANQRALAETARCLRRGGRFVLETRNRPHQILYAPYHLEVARADGSTAVIRSRYDATTHRMCSVWSTPDPDETELYRAVIRLYGVEELEEMFQEAGLAVDRICSDYDGTEFEGWERVLILVAHRR
jgi:ubiquinone/menaquinone biosynthesis C-methylase UbiE